MLLLRVLNDMVKPLRISGPLPIAILNLILNYFQRHTFILFFIFCAFHGPIYAPFIVKVHLGRGVANFMHTCVTSLLSAILSILCDSRRKKKKNTLEMSSHVWCILIQLNYLIPFWQANVDLWEMKSQRWSCQELSLCTHFVVCTVHRIIMGYNPHIL